MKPINRIIRTLMLFALSAVIITACSKKPQTSASSATNLKYSFKGNTAKHYVTTSKINQLIVAGGQEVGADVENIISYSVLKTGESNEKLNLKITVDSIYGLVKSMQGSMVNNPEEVKNKEFNMILSKDGEESGLEEAAQIEYSGVGGEKVNLKTSFSFIFTDLPAGAASIGYTWTDNDTIDMSASGQTVLMILNSNNTITAREDFMGYDCYKIEYSSNGERNSSGDTPQGFMTSSGNLAGSGYFYFAIKEGFVVKDHNEQKFEGELTIPTGDSFPMYMDIIIDVDLIK